MDDIAIPVSTDVDVASVAPRVAKPRVWTVFVALVAALALQVVFGGVIIVMAAIWSGDAQEFFNSLDEKLAKPEIFMLMVCLAELSFGLAAIVPAWLSPVPLKQRLGLLPAQSSWVLYPLTMLGSWAPLALGLGMTYALKLIVPPDKAVQTVYDNITLAHAIPFVLIIALAPGMFEELMFRGYMQRRLLERWEPGLAIVVSSTLFALVHVQPLTILAALPLGVWFGVVACKCRSIVPSILGHAFVNGSLNSWRMLIKFGDIPETTQTVVEVACFCVGLICFMLSLNCLGGEEEDTGLCS